MPSHRLNPLQDLPAAQELAELLGAQPELAAAFCHLLRQLGEQAEGKAESAWQKRKAPMAAYWRACGVYARHLARAVDRAGNPASGRKKERG
jgi:hypothetical protein